MHSTQISHSIATKFTFSHKLTKIIFLTVCCLLCRIAEFVKELELPLVQYVIITSVGWQTAMDQRPYLV